MGGVKLALEMPEQNCYSEIFYPEMFESGKTDDHRFSCTYFKHEVKEERVISSGIE